MISIFIILCVLQVLKENYPTLSVLNVFLGLLHVRQSLKTFQPIDELKKGPFTLRVQVLGYQPTDLGVEVDICLSATSRSRCIVWESILTLLSENKLHKAIRCSPKNENESE